MRLTRTRILAQAFFFGLFIFLVAVTHLRALKGYPVSLFLEMDPLNGLATALAVREVYRGLIWGLVILVTALLLGRFFCGWICPFGTLHHFIGFLFGRRAARRPEANRYRRAYATKYLLLAGLLTAAAAGSLQIGWLDPLSLLHRSVSTALLPAASRLLPGPPRSASGAPLIGLLFLLPVALNLVIPRLFCRALCPLGALLGLAARVAPWGIARDPARCTGCGACARRCEGACNPDRRLIQHECMVCFNCVDDCPSDAMSFQLMPKRGEIGRESGRGRPRSQEERAGTPALPGAGRRAALAGLGGLFAYGLLRGSGAGASGLSTAVIRPPGSVEEAEFLGRCLKCGQCLRVCPSGVLQPAALEAGLEGLWTPRLEMARGACEPGCTLCGRVCPTGAIQPLTPADRLGLDPARGPVRIGTAFVDRGRCLPWAGGATCVVCEEVCPVSPKAVFTHEAPFILADGRTVTLRQPYVDPARCTGCGVCEFNCPVKTAIRVTAAGETRSRNRALLLS